MGVVFKDKNLLKKAVVHPSYLEIRDVFGDAVRERKDIYGLYNLWHKEPEKPKKRKTVHDGVLKALNTPPNYDPKRDLSPEMHNQRLEFIGDAVLEFLASTHLFALVASLPYH